MSRSSQWPDYPSYYGST